MSETRDEKEIPLSKRVKLAVKDVIEVPMVNHSLSGE
jgi:hypothetical protein